MSTIKFDKTENEELEFLTPVDVAKILGCSEQTARRLFNRDDFPSIRVGILHRILKSEFIKWSQGNSK